MTARKAGGNLPLIDLFACKNNLIHTAKAVRSLSKQGHRSAASLLFQGQVTKQITIALSIAAETGRERKENENICSRILKQFILFVFTWKDVH